MQHQTVEIVKLSAFKSNEQFWNILVHTCTRTDVRYVKKHRMFYAHRDIERHIYQFLTEYWNILAIRQYQTAEPMFSSMSLITSVLQVTTYICHPISSLMVCTVVITSSEVIKFILFYFSFVDRKGKFLQPLAMVL